MERKWKQFERLVAAIHHGLNQVGATIQWSERIEGREFDLTIRFSNFGYNYLTLVECKDYLVPAKEVEAFVTKSRRASANKAVIVSSVGFQAGAIEVGKGEGIDLYILKESDKWPEQIKVKGEKPSIGVTDVELMSASRVVHRFPNNASPLEYFMRETRVIFEDTSRSLDEIVMADRSTWEKLVGKEARKIKVTLPKASRVVVPNLDPFEAVQVSFTAQLVSALVLDTGGIDPSLIPAFFSFKNPITGRERLISETEIFLGFDTKIIPGHFYYNPLRGQSYYCEKLEGNRVEYVLLESYQHGNLFQMRVRATLIGRLRVIEITDLHEITRLRRMYEKFSLLAVTPKRQS